MKWFVLLISCMLSFTFGYLAPKKLVLSEVSGRSGALSDFEDPPVDVVSGSLPAIDVGLPDLAKETNRWDQVLAITVLLSTSSVDDLRTLADDSLDTFDEPFFQDFFYLLLAKWGTEDLPNAVHFLVELEESKKLSKLQNLRHFVVGWAERDAIGLWSYADTMVRGVKLQSMFRYEALSAMAGDDPVAAIAYYETFLRDGGKSLQGIERILYLELSKEDLGGAKLKLMDSSLPERSYVLAGILEYYSQEDYIAGLEFVESLSPNMVQSHDVAHRLLGPLLNESPEVALSAVYAMKPGAFREQIFSYMMSMWSGRDLDAAVNWALPRIDEAVVRKAWESMVFTFARLDPERGLRIIEQNPSLLESKRNLISNWFQHDQDEALKWVQENMDPVERAEILRSSMYSIVRNDPEMALRLLDMMPMGRDRDRALSYVSSMVAERDVELAMEWLSTQSDDSAKMNALSLVISNLADRDPLVASEYALGWKTENTLLREKLVEQVAGTWARTDALAAINWLSELGAGLSKSSMQSVLHSWASRDLKEASDYVMQMPEGEDRSNHLGTLVVAAVQSDSKAAVQWMESLPEAEQSDQLVRGLISAWTSVDSIKASEWVNALPRGKKRDVASSEIVSQISRKAPRDAMPWALDIEDEILRNRALLNIASGASRLDREIVEQAIDASSYDEKKKAQYRKNYLR